MEKILKSLAALLALQLALVVGVNISDAGLSGSNAATPLISVSIGDVDRIEIAGAGGAEVAVKKAGDTWVLPALGDFPANSVRADRLLEQLEGLTVRSPIATSRAALDRFRVADEDFERRVTLFNGEEELAQVYLGTSSSMRQTHARASSASEVYVIDLPTYDLAADTAGWTDKSVLTVPSSSIERVRVGELELTRAESSEGDDSENTGGFDDWQAEGLAGEQRLSPGAADKLVSQLATLRFDEVVVDGPDTPGDIALEVTAFLDADGPRTYTMRSIDDEYTLQVSDRNEAFKLSTYQAERLLEAADPELLVQTNSENSEAVAGAGEEGEADFTGGVDS